MASVVRRTKSRYWTACFTSRDGRQLKKSTKTTDRRAALQIAIDLERVERQARAGTLTTTQLQKVLNDVSEKVTGDSIIGPSVEDYLTDWLNGVQVRNAKGTRERYGNTVRLLLEQLGDRAKKPINTLTSRDFDAFVRRRLADGAAPKTALIDLKTLGVAFRRAEAYGVILKNPVAAVQAPKVESSERLLFTQEEVQKLLAASPNLEWQTLILLGFFVGARLGDCARMRWENVHPDDGVLVYQQQKTGKKVIVPMHFHVIDHLNHLATFGTSGFLCPNLAGKGPGGKHGLSESFKRILTKAGLDPMTVPGKGTRNFSRRSFHSLRHSFNSALANAGVPEDVRMKLTGHSSKTMNTHYTHLDVGTLKTAVSSLPLFAGQKPGATRSGQVT